MAKAKAKVGKAVVTEAEIKDGIHATATRLVDREAAAAETKGARVSVIKDEEVFEVTIRLPGRVEVLRYHFTGEQMRNEPEVGNRLRELAESLGR